jgi:SOS-response transcriptional repressor LexA
MSRERDLTVNQQNMLQLLADCDKFHAVSPSIREFMEELGMSSTSVVNYNLEVLESEGLINVVPIIARSSHITESGIEAITPDPSRQKK